MIQSIFQQKRALSWSRLALSCSFLLIASSSTMSSLSLYSPVSSLIAQTVQQAVLIRGSDLSSVQKTSDLLIGTHDGSFHCDEALAISLLCLSSLAKGKTVKILRSRNPALLQECDMLVDVGAVYEPSRHRYDHHQRDFHDCFSSDFHTRLSSAGLVYKHFGHDLLAQTIANFQPGISPSEESASLVEKAYWKVYKSFIEHIDANDNGIAVVEDGAALKYHVSTTLADRVGRLNLGWNEVIEGGDEEGEQGRRFLLAMSIASAAFLDEVYGLACRWWPARRIVEEALEESRASSSPAIVVLPQYCPWTQHLFALEEEKPIEQKVLYVVYPDRSDGWRLQAVPVSEHSFTSRKALPGPWRGLREQVLSDVTGIPGCIFVHAGGFIGGHRTKEGALEMAQKALSFGSETN